MKKSIKKIAAGISAAAMLASAMPIANAFADEAAPAFETREVEGGVVITNYVGEEADTIKIPTKIDDKDVIGVDNYAFGLISRKVKIVVPASLTLDNIASEAFVTTAVINSGVVVASGQSTIEGILEYWVNDVVGMNYTDAEIKEAIKRAYDHVKDVDFTGSASLAESALVVLREIQAGNCGFSKENIDRLDTALDFLPYASVVLAGPDETDAQSFAASKLNLKYDVQADYLVGDVNGDGKIDVLDAIEIAKYRLDPVKNPLTEEQLLAADMNQDGVVDILDPVEIAKYRLQHMHDEE